MAQNPSNLPSRIPRIFAFKDQNLDIRFLFQDGYDVSGITAKAFYKDKYHNGLISITTSGQLITATITKEDFLTVGLPVFDIYIYRNEIALLGATVQIENKAGTPNTQTFNVTIADGFVVNVDVTDLNAVIEAVERAETAANNADASADIAANSSGVQYLPIVTPDSTNILNPALIIGSSYIGTGGQVVSTTASFSVVRFIEWGSNTQLVAALNGIAATSLFSLAQYNASQVFISGSYRGTDNITGVITKYAGASYIGIAYRVALVNQINFGATVLPYEPYFVGSTRYVGYKNNLGTDVTFVPNIEDANLVNTFTKQTQLNTSIKQQDGVWASSKIVTVKKDGTGDFTNLMLAMISITDASPSNRYIVQVYDNHIGLVKSDFTAVPSIGPYWALAWIRDYVLLMGMGEEKLISGEIPNTSAKLDFEQYETCHLDGFGEAINIRFEANRIRYAIHYDQGNGAINQNAITLDRFCDLSHLGAEDVVDSPQGTRWAAVDAYGSGTTSGTQQYSEYSKRFGARYGDRSHGNTLSLMPNIIGREGCYIASRLANGVAGNYDNLGFQQKRYLQLVGTNTGGSIALSNGVGTATLINKVLPGIKVVGYGNTPSYFINNQPIGSALKITSKSTGVNSVVKLVSDEAGLFGDVYSYAGSIGLSGSIWGNNELVSSGTDKRNIIGHRLGNCSVVNKTLVLNIDGTNRTVTFNQNYSNGNYAVDPLIDETTILASINSQITTWATPTYFVVNSEYYPELTDVLNFRGNTSTTNFIPKGSPIRKVGLNQCRIALSNEISHGMAIDDIPVYQKIMRLEYSRYIENCIVAKTGRFAPLFETGSDTFVEGDCFKVSVNSKFEKDATLKDSFAVALDSTYILLK